MGRIVIFAGDDLWGGVVARNGIPDKFSPLTTRYWSDEAGFITFSPAAINALFPQCTTPSRTGGYTFGQWFEKFMSVLDECRSTFPTEKGEMRIRCQFTIPD